MASTLRVVFGKSAATATCSSSALPLLDMVRAASRKYLPGYHRVCSELRLSLLVLRDLVDLRLPLEDERLGGGGGGGGLLPLILGTTSSSSSPQNVGARHALNMDLRSFTLFL